MVMYQIHVYCDGSAAMFAFGEYTYDDCKLYSCCMPDSISGMHKYVTLCAQSYVYYALVESMLKSGWKESRGCITTTSYQA